MQKIWIFILFITLSLLQINHCLAVAQPPGEIPKTEPLQPLNEFVKPNISKNINYNPEAAANESESTVDNINNISNSVSAEPSVAEVTPHSITESMNRWGWLIALVLAIIAGLFIWSRRRKK